MTDAGASLAQSFQFDQYYDHLWSGLLTDGALFMPIAVMSQMKLTETYALPPIGTTAMKAIVDVHDDTIELTIALVGPERFAWKVILETMAESSKRGSPLTKVPLVKNIPGVSGLALVTSMTIRTDLQVKTLVFTASATRRDTLDAVITLAYMPRPSKWGKILDASTIVIGALGDCFG
ncbi:MAG TPA: hypothetical protein VFV91_14520 [Gaiellaceae bacterium]|jgi:hypothetical protein|nr:hypothetical protein [Gaiellaceae bacterium]